MSKPADLKERLSSIISWSWALISRGKDPKEITVHPKTGKHITYKFSIGSRHFYQFLHDYELPALRLEFAKQFTEEMRMKCTLPFLQEWVKKGISYFDVENGGTIKLGKIWELLKSLEYRLTWLYEPDSLVRFASVIYFTLDEDITDYDMVYNKSKISLFKKKRKQEDFLADLMEGSEKLLNSSTEDLQTYLKELEDMVKTHKEEISTSKASKESTGSGRTPT